MSFFAIIYINKLTKTDNKQNQGNGRELKVQGINTNDINEIALTFNKYFIDTVQNLSDTFGAIFKQISAPNHTKPVFNLTEVPHGKILKILSTLKSSKAKDVFEWDSTFIKSNNQSFSTPTARLVNMSFEQSTFPNAWKSAVVVPIFKTGEPTEVNNYRPISILPVVSKIAEKVVAEQLTAF